MNTKKLDKKVVIEKKKKEEVLILKISDQIQLQELFEKFIPPAYSRPIVAILSKLEKMEING